MKWIFGLMIVASVAFGLFSGNIDGVTNAAISESVGAVQLVVTLAGGLCLWSGIMKIAEKAGLTQKIASLLSPITCRIFKGLKKDDPAMQSISMNITANMLGLGNAATPLGLKAMQQLEEQTPVKGTASNNMIMMVVLNTASVQLIPTTVATLRLAHGSANPMEIIPAVLITSIVSLTAAVLAVKLFARRQPE